MQKYFATFLSLLSFLSLSSNTVYAQAPADYNSADIYLDLKKLNVLGSVLYLAAHPDDENTRLLAYFAKEKLYRTGYLSLTRGDGGQNLIGDEQGVELGLIRTQELLAARRIDGAEQFFGTAFDFGFSKNATEALKMWDHDKMLSDVVWVIRKFRPDVIITRFPPDQRAGHGHHWASAILAREAFAAAADSTKFPEQFQYGVRPWQAKRIFWNTYNFGGNNTTAPDQLTLDIGAYNPLLGQGYGEIAAESRSQHKSQGFGVSKQRGKATEYFSFTDGTPATNEVMDGITTTWQRVEGGALVSAQVDSIIAHYSFEHPENSVQSLIALYKAISRLPDSYWEKKKSEEVKQLIAECSGLFFEANANKRYAITGDTVAVTFTVNKRNDSGVKLANIALANFDTALNNSLPVNINVVLTAAVPVSKDKPLYQPYWLNNSRPNGSFTVRDQQLIGKAENDADYEASFVFTIGIDTFRYERPVRYKYTDAIKGEIYEPLVVIPPFTVAATPGIALLNVKPQTGKAPVPELKIVVKSNINEAQLPVTVQATQGNKLVYTKDTVLNAVEGKEYLFATPLSDKLAAAAGNTIGVSVTSRKNNMPETYRDYLRFIHYDHIPDITYHFEDGLHLVTAEIKTVGKTIGYITGAGDKVPQALTQMGYNVTLLGENDITPSTLARFDAVISGIRAYNLHHWLAARYDVLMNYIKNGGNYIVQYNQQDVVTQTIGPYPFSLSRNRITDETADVKPLLPNSSVLNYPNKITNADFASWVQERSIYHAQNIDNHYQMPLAMHDPGEEENNGSLIVAPFGKGNFVYTGIVFFRELPAGVAGAYRLMANLIALPKNKVE